MPRVNHSRISQNQWDTHKDTIKRLYLTENTNLEGHGGVIELMRQDGLHASKPQYETQFRRWGFRKKLSGEAWHTIGHIIERHDNEGLLSCVYAYGTRLPSEKVKKETARYRLCTAGEQGCTRATLPDGIIIREDLEEVIEPITSLIPRGIDSGPVSRSPGLRPSERIERPQRATLAADFHLYFNPQSFSGSPPGLPLSGSVAGEAGHYAQTSDALASVPSPWPSPSSQFADDADYLITRRACSDWSLMEHYIPVNTTSLFDTLDISLHQVFRPLISSVGNYIISPSSQMRHLLPWKTSHELQRASADIVIVKQIMFLLMNNFAGSDYAAFDIIFEEVKRFSVFQMENILNAIPDPYTSALQQSILTIAIKSNVPPIVEILLRRGLDANRVTCRFGGKLFTPLDLACIFDRLEVVKILICHGANPNRKIHPDGGAAHHLLNLNPSAIEYPPNTCAILQCLLMAHARIYCQLLRSRQFWTSGLLVDVYIRYSKYPIEFTNYNELKDPFFIALTFCSSERSTAAIKTMIGSGGDTTHPKYPFYNRTLGNILRFVSYQGNSYPVDYILDSGIARDSGCRCEAVRGNNVGLVQKYVRAGVDIHGTHFAQSNRPPNPGALPQDIEPQLLKGSFLKYKTTTPFAEAIRWRRQHLSEEFQNLNHLGDTAIGPLLLAAIEIGDKKIVQRLLDLDHVDYRYTFALPYYISAAVLGNHEEIVEILLQAGFPPSSHCVLSAIFVRNARLIDLFLDSQFLINCSEMAVYFAVRWGNLGVLKKLIAVGFPVKGIQVNRDSSLFLVSYTADTRLSPLGEAIKQDNIPILRLLLENGAAIDSPIPTGTESPLIIAISSGNEQMVGELLARGVDPNDPGALKAAVVQSMEMVKIILTAFLRRYPTGDKGFFDSTLRKAIREKKEKIIWMLVKHADLKNAGWMKEIRAGEQQYRQYVIPWGTEYLPTLLGEGIATRSVNIVRMLLDSGGDPNSTVEIISKSPPGGRLIAISKAISTGDLDMLKLLHRTGADLHFNATLRIARTSLQLATELGHSDIVQYLLDHSVDVNASPCNFAGGTALQFAAKAGSVGTAELLLQHGADINAPGSRYGGKTAFEFAAEFGRMDMLLLLFHRCVDLVSDGGAQIRRACRFAEENGQVVSKSLVMQLAEAKGMNVFPRGGYSNVGVVGLPVRGGSNLSFGG